MSDKLIYVGETERGYAIYKKPNGVGGNLYISDEISGGVPVWDTIVDVESVMLALKDWDKELFSRIRDEG